MKRNISKGKKLFIELNEYDLKFVKILKHKNVKKVNFIILGNSIAFGFSLTHKIIPLLKRNIFLEKRLKENSIECNFYNFARPQDNNDEHTLDYIVNNKKTSFVDKLIKIDLGNSKFSMRNFTILKNYCFSEDLGITDLIKLDEEGLVNIIIYSGVTGSFLDNITRSGENYIRRFL